MPDGVGAARELRADAGGLRSRGSGGCLTLVSRGSYALTRELRAHAGATRSRGRYALTRAVRADAGGTR